MRGNHHFPARKVLKPIDGPLRFSLLSTLTTAFCSTTFAAPQVQILSGETVVTTIGALAGTLQVQADETVFDASNGKMRLKGNVVLTAKNARGRVATIRANDAILASPDAEFQITAKLLDPQMGWFDSLRNQGGEAGFVESVLRDEVQKHAGFSSYRARFSGVGAGAQTSGSVVYNRREQTLKIYRIFNYPGAGILDVEDVTYMGISADVLQKNLNVKDEKGEFRRDRSGQIRAPSFSDLAKQGVKLVDKSRHQRFPVKNELLNAHG